MELIIDDSTDNVFPVRIVNLSEAHTRSKIDKLTDLPSNLETRKPSGRSLSDVDMTMAQLKLGPKCESICPKRLMEIALHHGWFIADTRETVTFAIETTREYPHHVQVPLLSDFLENGQHGGKPWDFLRIEKRGHVQNPKFSLKICHLNELPLQDIQHFILLVRQPLEEVE